MDNKAPVTIGRISACIAGDHRYTDTLVLTYDPNSRVVTCEVRSTTASGGMDGPGGTDPARLQLSRSTLADPTPKQVLLLAKDALARSDFNFERYGKPTKRFCWATLDGDKHGLSQALAREALACATWKPEPVDERLL